MVTQPATELAARTRRGLGDDHRSPSTNPMLSFWNSLERTFGVILATTASYASPIPVVVIGLILVIVWGVSRYLWPLARCRKCAGSGKNWGSTGKRWGECKRCGGSGRRQRLGSKQIHRAVGRRDMKGR